MKLPTEAARNQTPIIRLTILARRQLRHRAEADRAQAQLAERVQQVDHQQPCRPRPVAAGDRRLRGRARGSGSRGPRRSGPRANLVGLAGWLVPSLTHSHANSGARRKIIIAFTRLPPTARELMPNPTISLRVLSIGEEVQRRSRLLEHRPEERRGDERTRQSCTGASARRASSRQRMKSEPKNPDRRPPAAGSCSTVVTRSRRDRARRRQRSAHDRGRRSPATPARCRRWPAA